MLLGIFGLAGATTYQFFRGRRRNLELMRDYIRELENALKPKDKLYTLLGLYSGFKGTLRIDNEIVREVEVSVGLMPRESLLYYPISLLTLKHDRLYLVFKLKKKPSYEGHIIRQDVLKYNKAELDSFKVKQVRLYGKTYLTDCEEVCLKHLKEIVVSENVLHVALVPKTRVLYVFMKPKPGLPSKTIQKAMKVLETILS